jgi:hypothetical protein
METRVAAEASFKPVMRLFGRLGRCSRHVAGWPLVCTPFEGCYGRAGWVLAVNGSPPRGTIVLFNDFPHRITKPFFYIDSGMSKSHRLSGDEQARTLARFFEEHLRNAAAPFEVHRRRAQQRDQPARRWPEWVMGHCVAGLVGHGRRGGCRPGCGRVTLRGPLAVVGPSVFDGGPGRKFDRLSVDYPRP